MGTELRHFLEEDGIIIGAIRICLDVSYHGHSQHERVHPLSTVHIFSERELKFMFAICHRPSVCRLSVCRLSVVCL